MSAHVAVETTADSGIVKIVRVRSVTTTFCARSNRTTLRQTQVEERNLRKLQPDHAPDVPDGAVLQYREKGYW